MFSRHRGHTFVAPPTDNAIDIVLSSNTFDFNLLALLGAALTEVTTVTIRVETGVLVVSMSPLTPAMDLRNVMFAGSTLRLINAGYILGRGGDGGRGAAAHILASDDDDIEPALDGRDGGNAIIAPGAGITFEITNGAGRIWGGGGGGGGGGAGYNLGNNNRAAGGGGGGGAGGGRGGDAGAAHTSTVAGTGGEGSTGVNGAFGAGGAAASAGSASGGAGGDGGDWGGPGANGGAGAGSTTAAAGSAGAAGKAIELNGGAATFLNGGGAPNVKGAVT